ncbi:MAG: hypothetical protein J7L88_04595 [Thermoplasmata archaeon]|nr:hypothetical protein [Thermoplasmata archaeon]
MEEEDAITVSKKGVKEIRELEEAGRYAIYLYRDLESGEVRERKRKLVLLSDDGEWREFFIIPTKTPGRDLLLHAEEKERGRGIKTERGVISLKEILSGEDF